MLACASASQLRSWKDMKVVQQLLTLIQLLAADRARLVMENLALRQQITVLKRTTTRVRIEDSDRDFWVLLSKVFRDWREHLHIVQPETVIRWHREGFAKYWKRRSRSSPGRPPIGRDVIALIKRMSRDNVTWGSPRIRDELALLGHPVAKSTVERYMVPRPKEPSQSWRTFLSNHMPVAAACDFFVVPSITFKALYVFVVLSHDRRRILHVNVTKHPSAEWTAQQLLEAFPWDREKPRFLHRDRDSIYGEAFRKTAQIVGLTEVISAKESPWQNPYVERVIGSIRRECTDHVGELHLFRVLREYVAYYNESRTHSSLTATRPSVARSMGETARSRRRRCSVACITATPYARIAA